MKRTIAVLGTALAAGALAGCGGGHDETGQSTTPATATQALDTAQVLTLAKSSSESSSPFTVNNGALTLTDTSDTASPLSID